MLGNVKAWVLFTLALRLGIKLLMDTISEF